MAATSATNDLNTRYSLSESHISLFRQQGFIMLKNVFSKELLHYYGTAITDCVIEHNDLADVPMHNPQAFRDAVAVNLPTRGLGAGESLLGIVSDCEEIQDECLQIVV